MDADGLQDAIKGMQNDPELLAAFAEAQAELEQKKSKKMKKKKKKKKGVNDQLAELEKMMAQIEDGAGDMDLETATATLAMLEGEEEKSKKTKKKKIKKEKLPAPFQEVQEAPTAAEILKDLDINELAPEHRAALESAEFEPTPEEIEAEFQKLKAEQEAKKKRKAKEKKKAEQNLLRDEDGNVLLDENGQPITMDDPELLAALLEDEDDEDMRKILQKKAKKSKKKKKGKIKKEKSDPKYEENINPEMFHDEEGFGWQKKDAQKKMFKPKTLKTQKATGEEAMETNQDEAAEIAETEEEIKRRAAREAGEEIAPADAPIIDDFGPALPEHGVPARAETGAIPGGSKLKPIEDDEEIEKRLRQKALQKAIQDRLDKRLMRQKRIEVRLASWIGKQQSLKNEAKLIAEERLQRAKEITDAMSGEVAEANEKFVKDRNDIVASVRDQLRADVGAEIRREIEEEENRKIRKTERAPEAPKVPAAVMDAIQMSDAWEQFWRRYKSQLKDWSHWD